MARTVSQRKFTHNFEDYLNTQGNYQRYSLTLGRSLFRKKNRDLINLKETFIISIQIEYNIPSLA